MTPKIQIFKKIFFEKILLHGESLVFYSDEMISMKIATEVVFALSVNKSRKVENLSIATEDVS